MGSKNILGLGVFIEPSKLGVFARIHRICNFIYGNTKYTMYTKVLRRKMNTPIVSIIQATHAKFSVFI